MNFHAALSLLPSSGSLLVQMDGRTYRLVFRHRAVRLVVDETDLPTPLPPSQAEAVANQIAAQADRLEASPSFVEVPIAPPDCAVLINASLFLPNRGGLGS